MISDDLFKFDMSLQELSAISLAIGLWKCQDIDTDKCLNLKDETSETNIIKLDLIPIPPKLKPLIRSYVIKIGQKISHWRKYVTDVLKLNPRYADKIYWTAHGQINDLKILQLIWLKDRSLPRSGQCKCFLLNNTCCLAAMFGQEKFVKSNIKYMKSKILENIDYTYREKDWTPYAIIVTWVYFCEKKEKFIAVRDFKSLVMPPDAIPAISLFWDCILKGNEFGAKYFWNRLKPSERLNSVSRAAAATLGISYNSSNAFVKEVNIRLFQFFVNQMTVIEKTEFISKNFISVFELHLQNWPYQELCENLLFQFEDHISQHGIIDLLNLIYKYMSRRKLPDYFTFRNFYKKIFQKLFDKVSIEIKIEFLMHDNYFIIRDALKHLHYDNLNLFINDADLINNKKNMLTVLSKILKGLLLENDYENVNKFIENMEWSDEEIKFFKQSFGLLQRFLMSGDITAAKKHLNWLFDSEYERDEFMKTIDGVEISLFLFNNFKFDSAFEFLYWRLNTEKELEKVLKQLKSEKFLIGKIFEIWSGKNDEAFENCNKLFKWCFETAEEIEEFKRTKLSDDIFLVIKYWNALYGVKTLKNFDAFLKFCSRTSDEIEVMKINIANDFNWWIETYAMEKSHYFGMVLSLWEWVYGENEEERRRVIGNYINSPRGSLLCFKIFKSSPPHIIQFFNSWIKEPVNFKKLNKHIDYSDRSVVGNDVFFGIKSMLKKREALELVKPSDLNGCISNERHYDNAFGYHHHRQWEDEDEYYGQRQLREEDEDYGHRQRSEEGEYRGHRQRLNDRRWSEEEEVGRMSWENYYG